MSANNNNNNNNDTPTAAVHHKVWAPKPTEHCVLCVPDNEKKVRVCLFNARIFIFSLSLLRSLKFPIPMCALLLTI
jgi:hypothetical protein